MDTKRASPTPSLTIGTRSEPNHQGLLVGGAVTVRHTVAMELLITLLAIALVVAFVRAWEGARRSRRKAARQQSGVGDADFELIVSGTSFGRASDKSVLERAREGESCWLPPGQSFEVAGRTIQGGMIYLGKRMDAISEWGDGEPSLVRPRLKVAKSGSTVAASSMGYWPSYSSITPGDRAVYLDWLADGRKNPEVDIGYVFLFFYGLERRLLFDLVELEHSAEKAALLVAELRRLLSIYGGNRSFLGYARSLLLAAQVLWENTPAYLEPVVHERDRGDVSNRVRLAIGQLVDEGKPIPGEWALAWVMQHPETRLRTPSKRCPEEFKELFLARYAGKYGDGMKLKPNKRRLKIRYHPASASFGGNVDIPCGDLPDIAALSRPVANLRSILESSEDDLSTYSRAIGKSPEKASSAQAFALLPPELAASRTHPRVEALKNWVKQTLAGQSVRIVPASDFHEKWDWERADRMSAKELTVLSKLLEAQMIGIEPDPRFGGGRIAVSASVAFFRLEGDQPDAPTAAYRAATLLLHLAAMVAAGDGEVSLEERRHLAARLERTLHLAGAEARRIRAHLELLLADAPSFAGIKKRIESIDSRQKQVIAEFSLSVAAADGVIDPGEIKVLEKIYKMLGFDPAQVLGDIHSLSAQTDWKPAAAPVAVLAKEDPASDFAIPTGPTPSAPVRNESIELDMTKVERTIAETAIVSSILAEIFEDELPSEHVELAPEPGTAGLTLGGLDAAHSTLLRLIDGREMIDRDDFETFCEDAGLLVNGAIEVLNDAAFEAVDFPLLEGNDPLAVDREAWEALAR